MIKKLSSKIYFILHLDEQEIFLLQNMIFWLMENLWAK